MRFAHPAVLVVLACVTGLSAAAVGQNPQPAPAGARGAQPAASPAPLGADAPFTVAVATAVVEAAPVYMTAEGPFATSMQYINGGVRTLAGNGAHAAGNATTQMLVVLRDNANVRLLFTLAEGLYRIVGKRSSGITTLADLKGKRVVVPRNTSAHYYLVAMLRSVGLQESDVTLVNAPATGMAAALVNGSADALSMWEPESQNAVAALGADAVIFQNNALYREFYSLYSTTDVMRDPRRHGQLVDFVRALHIQTDELKKDPKRFFPLISRITKHPENEVARGWEHHAFPFNVPGDMLDIITDEERWVAAMQQRAPRTRTELAGFIDTSILTEALGPR
jgi:sulfonate transport system substrate-binding protein